MGCSVDKSDKIGGYDRWDVQSDADTLIRAEEIKKKGDKYYKVVMGEVQKKADAATLAAGKKQEAVDQLKLEKKVGEGLKKVFKKKGNPHPKKGGY